MKNLRNLPCWLVLAGLVSALPGIAAAHFAISQMPRHQTSPAVTFDGKNYLVVWEDTHKSDYTDIYGARVSRDGVLIDTQNFVISSAWNSQRLPDAASDGKRSLVVWEDARSQDLDIYGNFVDQDGRPGKDFVVCGARGDQSAPAVVFTGKNYLVVWTDHRGSDWVVYGTHVTPDGQVLNPDGFVVSPEFAEDGNPGMAFDGKDCLVAWTAWHEKAYHTHAQRVGLDGTRTGPMLTIADAKQGRSPAVGSDGKNYMFTWTDWRAGTYDIYGARLAPDGTVLDTAGIGISTADYDQIYPCVVSNESNYLVAWQDMRDGLHWQVYATIVTPEGYVRFPNGIAFALGDYTQVKPAAASDGKDYLVVWEDWENGTGDIYGLRVGSDGQLK